MSCSTTTSARAKAASVAAASPASQSKTWLLGGSVAVVADDRRVGIERAPRVDDRLERLVLDVDQLERVARGVVVVGDDERDLLALEADLVGREHGLAVGRHRRHPRHAARLEVAAGDDRVDLRQRERGGGVDRDDPRVRERAAQDRAVQRARAADVVEERALPADEARVLLALQPPEADRAPLSRRPSSPAAPPIRPKLLLLAPRVAGRRLVGDRDVDRPAAPRTSRGPSSSCSPGPSRAARTLPHSHAHEVVRAVAAPDRAVGRLLDGRAAGGGHLALARVRRMTTRSAFLRSPAAAG